MIAFFMVWYVMMVMWTFCIGRAGVRRLGTKFLGRWAPKGPVRLRYLLLVSFAWPGMTLVEISTMIFKGIKSLVKLHPGEKW